MKPLTYYTYDDGGWFRLFGFGLYWKDVNKNPLLFSERNGYVKNIRLGKWFIGVLPK